MSTLIISISAMCCPAEGGPVEQVLRAAPGVADVTLDYSTRTARVTGDRISGEALLEALLSIGMPGELVVTGARRIVLSVPEMDCPVEADKIQKAFAAAGITGADFNVMTRTVTLSGDDDLEAAAVRAVESCGYTAKAAASGPRTIESAPIPWALYITALFVAFMSEAVELVSEYSPGLIPLEHGTIDLITLALAVVAILMAGLEVFKNGVLALVHRNLNMNALMAVAVVGGVLIGAWPEAAMVMVLFQISESIEQLSMTKARRSIRDLMSAAPETAEVKDGRSWRRVPSSDVGAGAVVRVGPGDRVPLDGRIVRGATALDQSMVTGEGMPAEKSEGDNVWSGTVNLTSTIEVMVTAAASESLSARIIDAVENAQASKSPVQRFVDRFAAVYTPIVFFIAAAVAIVPGLVTGEWSTWIYRALCLLVISCPCALVISTPVTVVSALATATRCGLLIKGGLYLEEARKLVNIGLDKTGTLTKGEPAVAGVKYLATFDERLTGAMAASLAAMNKHPLSQAIARWAHERHLPVYQVEGFTAIPGAGVEGRIERGMVRLVNLRWLEEQGLADEEVRRTFAHYTNEGMSAVAVADAFGVQAVFGLADVVKEDTVEGLRQLASVGIRPWLLTGDNEAPPARSPKRSVSRTSGRTCARGQAQGHRGASEERPHRYGGRRHQRRPRACPSRHRHRHGRARHGQRHRGCPHCRDGRQDLVDRNARAPLPHHPRRARREHRLRHRRQDHLRAPRAHGQRHHVDGRLRRHGHLPDRGRQRHAHAAHEAKARPHGRGGPQGRLTRPPHASGFKRLRHSRRRHVQQKAAAES